MKIGVSHSKYIASRIATDLANLSFAKLTKGIEVVVSEAESLIFEELKKEDALEERVREMMEDYEDEIESCHTLDERNLFSMIKRKLAPEYKFVLSYEERFTNLAHNILQALISKELIEFRVPDIKIKTIIFESFQRYIEDRFKIEDEVIRRIESYKREIIPGTDEYYIIFQKLYEEELRKKGNF